MRTASWVRVVVGSAAFAGALLVLQSGASAGRQQSSAVEMAPGPMRILVADPTDTFTRVVTPRELVARPATATISVTYNGFSAAAQNAFQAAINIWQTQITSSVPIRVVANFTPLATGVLGSAGSNFVYRNFTNGTPSTFYAAALANKLAGSDLNPAEHDITANFSSTFSNWYFGTDGLTPAGQYDFLSVVLHELCHGLGFSGSMDVSSGSGSWGLGSPVSPMIFDAFAVNGSVQSLINTSLFANPSTALAAQLTGGNLFWNGTAGIAGASGARPRLYAPATWSSGSSFSHLDEATYPAGNANSLMTYAIGTAESIRDPGPITRGMFQDMGWTISGSNPPFGSVDTPAAGATGVTGSISVTGWALDDRGIAAVRIQRDPVSPEPAGTKIPVGTAVRVSGARPDVAGLYPTTPEKERAGWGYLLLTNMLPNKGNGTYTLYMYADDADGQTTLLGSRTITCSNATATKPFGAIDTPGQGDTVSGTSYVNFGWTLTPQPKTIPTDGSTINAFIDGVARGRPAYNQFRSDIAALFPGLNNTNGAIGALVLNTKTIADGLHTIQWVVIDNQAAAEGIGSRYFTIKNSALVPALESTMADAAPSAVGSQRSAFTLSDAAAVSLAPIAVRTGFRDDTALDVVWPDLEGMHEVTSTEMTRIVVQLEGAFGSNEASSASYGGCLRAGDELLPLPIGSTLDTRRGVFFWQPGPGFLGSYDLVFVRTDRGGRREQIPVRVILRPKY